VVTNKTKPRPLSGNATETQLQEILSDTRIRKLFCWHDWVYFKYGSATKLHRVCSKCRKKQSHNEVVPKNAGFWITEK
jgi:hypothetical protein